MNIERVSFENMNSRMNRIEKSNLKNYGKSLCTATLMNLHFNKAIIEIESDNDCIVLNKDMYKDIRKLVTSKEFVIE